MDVFLLSAGYGTRLSPLTNNVPKCLAPIGSIPLLAVWLNQLSKLEFVSKVYINTHYLSDQVLDFASKNHFDLNTILIVEDTILGTTESIRRELDLSNGDEFLIIHADNFSLQDLRKMYKIFQEKILCNRMTGIALGFESTDYENCGFFTYLQTNCRITSFIEKPGFRVEGMANGAMFMLTRELLAMSLNSSTRGDFCRDNLDAIARNLYLFKASGIHIDIGSPATLAQAQCHRYLLSDIDLDKSWQEGYISKIINYNLSSS